MYPKNRKITNYYQQPTQPFHITLHLLHIIEEDYHITNMLRILIITTYSLTLLNTCAIFAQAEEQCCSDKIIIDSVYAATRNYALHYRYYEDTIFALDNKTIIVRDSLRRDYDNQKLTEYDVAVVRDLIESCFIGQREKELKKARALLIISFYVGPEAKISEVKFSTIISRGNKWLQEKDLICLRDKLIGTCISVPEAFVGSPYFKYSLPLDFTKDY